MEILTTSTVVSLREHLFYLRKLEEVTHTFTRALDTSLYSTASSSTFDIAMNLLYPSLILFSVILLFTLISEWQIVSILNFKYTHLYDLLDKKLPMHKIMSGLDYIGEFTLHFLPLLGVYYLFNMTNSDLTIKYDSQSILITVLVLLILKFIAWLLVRPINRLLFISTRNTHPFVSKVKKSVLHIRNILFFAYTCVELLNLFSYIGKQGVNYISIPVICYTAFISLSIFIRVISYIDPIIFKIFTYIEENKAEIKSELTKAYKALVSVLKGEDPESNSKRPTEMNL